MTDPAKRSPYPYVWLVILTIAVVNLYLAVITHVNKLDARVKVLEQRHTP